MITTLTTEEDAVWVKAFSEHSNNGKSDAEADQLAWQEVQEQFPRLKQYEGCKP